MGYPSAGDEGGSSPALSDESVETCRGGVGAGGYSLVLVDEAVSEVNIALHVEERLGGVAGTFSLDSKRVALYGR